MSGREEDLNSLSQKYLTGAIPSGYSFSKERTRLVSRNIDIQDDGSAKVSAYLRASLLPEISLEDIRREISGKSIEEAQEYLRGRDQIMGVEIGIDTPFPFGKNSLPKNSANIKSHHNVGGLPKSLKLTLIEPIRHLYTDQVRAIAKKLDIPDEIINQQPHPGPGHHLLQERDHLFRP